MVAAAKLGIGLGITPPGTDQRIAAVLRQFDLPTSISATAQDYADTLTKDKKSDGSQISLIVLTELGKARAAKLETQRLLSLIQEVGL